MTKYTVYNSSTGRISFSGSTDGPTQIKNGSGELVLDGEELDESTHWIDSGFGVTRPSIDLAASVISDTSQTFQVNFVPIGSNLTVITPENMVYEETIGIDQLISIDFEYGGIYRVKISPPFPYVSSEIELDISDAS